MKTKNLLSLLLSSSLVLSAGMVNVGATETGHPVMTVTQVSEEEIATVKTVEEFKAALNNSAIKKIVLDSDLTLSAKLSETSRDTTIVLSRSLVIDGNGHTITGTATKSMLDILGNTEAITVDLVNLTLVNKAKKDDGRCIDLRNENVTLNLTNVTLDASGTTKNPQPLNVGGNFAGVATVNVENSLINAGDSGYGITTFNKVNLTVNNSLISGYAGLYVKAEVGSQGSTGSKLNLNNTKINSKSASACDFGAIVFEDNGVELNLHNSSINITTVAGDGNVHSAIHFGKYNYTGENTVLNNVVKLTGNTKVTTNGVGLSAFLNGETSNDVLVASGVQSELEVPGYCLPDENTLMEKEVDGETLYVSTPKVKKITVSKDKFEAVVGETYEFTYELNPEDTLFELELEDYPIVGNATIDKENKKVIVKLVGPGTMGLLLKAGDANTVVEFEVSSTFNVVFKNGEVEDLYQYEYGKTAEELELDAVEGYKFLGWYNGDELYDFSTPVTSHLTLVAKWEKVEEPKEENPEVNPEDKPTEKPGDSEEGDKEVEPGEYETSIPELDLTKPVDKVVVGVSDADTTKKVLEEAAFKEYGSAIEEAIKMGFDIETTLSYELVEAKDVEDDYKLIEKYIKDKKLEVAQLLDISPVILIDGTKGASLSHLGTPIKLRMALPKEYLKEGRTFKVLHVADGKIEELDSVVKDNYIEFESKDFSTFALSYTDKTTNVNNPDTGVTNIAMPVMGTVVALIGACLAFFLRKKTK